MMELVDIFSKDNIKVYEGHHHWEQALRLSIQPLIEEGCVLPCYLSHILADTKTYGAYYILRPEVAVAHTRWQNGALENRVVLTLFKDLVDFSPHGEQVKLFIGFCAKDDFYHLHYLKELAKTLKDDELIERLLGASTSEELKGILHDRSREMATI